MVKDKNNIIWLTVNHIIVLSSALRLRKVPAPLSGKELMDNTYVHRWDAYKRILFVTDQNSTCSLHATVIFDKEYILGDVTPSFIKILKGYLRENFHNHPVSEFCVLTQDHPYIETVCLDFIN